MNPFLLNLRSGQSVRFHKEVCAHREGGSCYVHTLGFLSSPPHNAQHCNTVPTPRLPSGGGRSVGEGLYADVLVSFSRGC